MVNDKISLEDSQSQRVMLVLFYGEFLKALKIDPELRWFLIDKELFKHMIKLIANETDFNMMEPDEIYGMKFSQLKF